jgi:hypothetical protein
MFGAMSIRREIEIGALFKKVGPNQPTWRAVSFLNHVPLPHAKLQRIDAPGTQMTIGIAALNDPRFFERVKATTVT